MAREIVCHQCHHRLRVAAHQPSRWVTCPRCLTSLSNPDTSEDRVAAEESRPAPRPERTCPECDEPVAPRWRVCPVCNAELDPRRGRRPSLENEAATDSALGGALLVLLGVLGCVGYVFLVFSAVNNKSRTFLGDSGLTITVVVGLVLGAAMLTGLVWALRSTNPADFWRGLVGILGPLAMCGVFGVLFLVFMFQVCATACSGVH